MVKSFFLSILALVFFSCDPCKHIEPNNIMRIKYNNKQGENIVGTIITEPNTEVYYVINGQEIRQFNPDKDAAKRIRIDSQDNEKLLTLFVYVDGIPNGKTTTILDFTNLNDRDTIVCTYDGCGKEVINAEYNGKPVLSGGLTIVKN